MSNQLSMTKKKDISVPEGYFGDLQMRLSEIPQREVRPGLIRRMTPYVAFAASIAAVVLIGNAILRKTAVPAPTAEDETWTYVSYLADALDPDGGMPDDGTDWGDGDEGLSDEDIINFLIADGISVEQLNYVSYEEGY